MSLRDDRFYAFIVARTSRSRSRIRRITLHKRWLKVSAACVLVLLSAAAYGFYALTQEVAHLSVERENERLREENAKQRQQLNSLNSRVEAVEDVSRRIAEMSGVAHGGDESPRMDLHETELRGAGGPRLPLDATSGVSFIEHKTRALESNLRAYETILRRRQMLPSLWPVAGNLTDGFGGRRDPFGGSASEFHAGQDIAAVWGTPVEAAGSGKISFAGWQNGYGQVVIIDHGGGLATRYGHLSQVNVRAGEEIKRGSILGRVGSTGRSTGPHLHYEVRINDKAVNPRPYLPHAAE
ncbi:MAG: M23 family metallopeptidase [Pyrinomonadaceae bacterium]